MFKKKQGDNFISNESDRFSIEQKWLFFLSQMTGRTFVGMCNRISINNSNRYLWQLNHLQSDVVKKLEENCKIQNFTFIFQVKSEKKTIVYVSDVTLCLNSYNLGYTYNVYSFLKKLTPGANKSFIKE